MTDLAELLERAHTASPENHISIAVAAYNHMAASVANQDYDTVGLLVEAIPEHWVPEEHRATWLLAGAHAIMHSTNPLVSRQRAIMDRFAAACVRPYCAARTPRLARVRPRRKIAVGFIGGVLAGTAYADRGIRDVLRGLDRDRLEVHALTLTAEAVVDKDWLGVDCVHAIGDESAGEHHLRVLGLDVLVYLDGVVPSMPWRLLAARTTQRQLAWIHTHLTFGSGMIDGQIADLNLIPQQDRVWYAEPVLDLEGTASSCRLMPRYSAAGPGPIISAGHITFGSFNRPSKISQACAHAWSQILQALPSALLLIVNEALVRPVERQALEARLQQARVPMDRVIFDTGGSDEVFFGRYSAVDLILDSFPFVGGLTSFDALAQSVPILTLEGPGFVERQSGTLLRAIGEPDLVTSTVNDYVAMAIALAGQPERLTALRLSLRERAATSSVFDMTSLAQRMSDLLVAQAARKL
ncbi:MAG: hypothetical protein EAZ99_15320 [Alphaproteobacteria bacterium]|nr:MAG: hypothetical protein EAZ99_15320 [Alphaproteobacteria bacterium]